MKLKDFKLLKETSVILNEKTRGCRNRIIDENLTLIYLVKEKSKNEKFDVEKLKIDDEIIFFTKDNLGTKKYPCIYECVDYGKITKITEKSIFVYSHRLSKDKVIGTIERKVENVKAK